jgi:hypothetical protein
MPLAQHEIPTDDLHQYLSAVCSFFARHARPENRRFLCLEELIVKEGLAFNWTPLPNHIERGEPRQCFMNAALLTRERPDLVYVEGYAVGVIPTLHAWCVDPTTMQVIDPTWDHAISYLGIPIRSEFLWETLLDRGYYGVLDNPEQRMSMLDSSLSRDAYWDTRIALPTA